MKRHGNLWEKIISPENIRAAYYESRKGKTKKKSVIKFESNINENLELIRQMLINKTFHTGSYTERTIYEPKKRTIYILPYFPDRIIHHAVMRVVSPIWDKLFIDQSYACRKGKGMHKGSKLTHYFVKHNKYCLKCDISKFYPSINHEILKQIIRKKIKDKNVLWLLDDIIDSIKDEKNVPIGNYTSQWFGNLYMNELDMYVKHTLRVKNYIRYCDDFLFFHNDKKYLNNILNSVRAFLKVKLSLILSKDDLFPTDRGVDFLGYRHFSKYLLLRKSTAKRAKRRIKSAVNKFLKHRISINQLLSTLESYNGWIKWARTFNLRRTLRLDYYVGVVKTYRQFLEYPLGQLQSHLLLR